MDARECSLDRGEMMAHMEGRSDLYCVLQRRRRPAIWYPQIYNRETLINVSVVGGLVWIGFAWGKASMGTVCWR